jgi:hypothetical protein
MKDTGGEIKTLAAVSCEVLAGAASATSEAIDRRGFDSCTFGIIIGEEGGTSPTYTVAAKVQSSATTGGTYADVTGATATFTDDTPDQYGEINMDLRGELGFLKLVITTSSTGGTSPTLNVAGTVTLGQAKDKPA